MELPVRGQHVFIEVDGIKIILTNPAKLLLNPPLGSHPCSFSILVDNAMTDQAFGHSKRIGA
jgi:hypothetical protein